MLDKTANIFIVGVQKAGTTSLHDYLSSHPEIRGAEPKEPGFYVKHGNEQGVRRLVSGTTPLAVRPYASVQEYEKAFGGDTGARWRLDSSTVYFQSAFARTLMAQRCPAARIIICLREPVARAHSAYNWAVKEGWETAASFEEALALEEQRRRDGYWFSYLYTDTSRYSDRLEAWRATFPSCKIVLFDDLQRDPLGVVNDVLTWLDLERFDTVPTAPKNPSGRDQGPLAKRLRQVATRDGAERGQLARLAKVVLGERLTRRAKQRVVEGLDRRLTPPPKLAAATRERLAPMFDADRRRLEEITGRDLSAWRQARRGDARV